METIGKYRVIRELGKGATATVYLCDDPDADRQVAVKVIQFGKDCAAMSRRLRKLFQNEGMVSRRLNHPNIVQVYDAVVEADYAYLAMEFVDGFSLEDHCRIDRLLPMHRVVGIIFKCAMALDAAFRQGIIHRDIKPANILIAANDEPKIADFGLALNLNKDLDRDSTFIMGVGSPAYMSPEQIKGYPLNQKTDLYSLGVLLFQLLTGRLPFRANNQATLVYKIINTDAPSVTALNPNLPEGLNAVVKKALEKDLYSRYRNGAEMAKDLSSVRFQILEEDETVNDQSHFECLRRLPFFTEFENVELWEVLRVAVWREVAANVALIREGEHNRLFGIIIEGNVEVSQGGKSICRLGPGEPVGEVAFLHPSSDLRHGSVVTLEPTRFLEINASALLLASEELLERMRNSLLVRLIERFRNVNKLVAAQGARAVDPLQSSQYGSGFGLKLVD
ncbi:serine/threonine-protein kinase [Azonexus hydrophilus]|jgi:serine/threonine protein kinase|uniref:serine/threonine-protein kinase n=1 Tax=Azonexus hydrophilus TaxID=418702 RepID=UPI001965395B|nr:serine/threonine-protein kinase [Azonexus hydrophilus]MBP8022590.1 protein kinase [Azonexus sp.]MDX9736512.1 serine/threonine-protein kinase [Azonexus sp.]